jgi:hypothetical protein
MEKAPWRTVNHVSVSLILARLEMVREVVAETHAMAEITPVVVEVAVETLAMEAIVLVATRAEIITMITLPKRVEGLTGIRLHLANITV